MLDEQSYARALLQLFFYSKMTGISVCLVRSKTFVNTEVVAKTLSKFESVILYHYIIPNDQTVRYETLILIGYKNIPPFQFITDIFKPFFICEIECDFHFNTYLTLLNNIDHDKNNLLNQSCKWVDQTFFGELLDLAEIYWPAAYVYH